MKDFGEPEDGDLAALVRAATRARDVLDDKYVRDGVSFAEHDALSALDNALLPYGVPTKLA